MKPMTDQTAREPRQPIWPLPDLLRAAEAHWNDAPRLRLLLRDLGGHADPGAAALAARVTARLRDLPPEPRLRVIRREAPRPKAPPLPETPTPEMTTLLRELARERASGDSARREAALLRRRLVDERARPEDDLLRQELEAARAEARAAREEAARLADRLAFATASPARRSGPRQPDPGHAPADPPPARRAGPGPDPAYAELGLSPDVPDDLLPVLERAFLRHHHPDRAAPDGRAAATIRFQSVTKAFARIRRIRGL